jgi:stearoyl-CoA desaturase (delta-9 desaturase)
MHPTVSSVDPDAGLMGAKVPLTVAPAAGRMQLFRLMAGAVILGPTIGAAAAIGLALATRHVAAVALVAFGIAYCLTTLGVTIGFHRYFSHRAFRTSRAVEVLFVVLGSCALQGTLLYWVSTHRRHHQFSDTPDDPHSPHFSQDGQCGGFKGFWHGHVGWMFASRVANPVRFAPDIIRDPLIFELQRHYWWWATLGLLLPPAVAAAMGQGPQVILETFLWAGPVRIVLLHHVSWAVGSFSHLYGARPFDTGDHSANNFWVALLGFGEGLQNNHHAFPRAAVHGLEWREPDLSGLVIRALAACKIIGDLHAPTPEAIRARRDALAFSHTRSEHHG